MAVSHVGLVFNGETGSEDGEKRFFDESQNLMLIARGDKVLAFNLSKTSTTAPDDNRLVWEEKIKDACDAVLISTSPDKKIIAVQRNERRIDFLHRGSDKVFSQECKKPTKNILGFFFVECEEGSFVTVTTSGLELYRFSADRMSLKLRNKFSQTIRWYVYTYATRVASIGTGKTGARVLGYQFTLGEIIRLPQVDFDAAPFPVTPEDLINPSMIGIRQPPPLVTAEDVVLLRLYNRVFIGHIDRSRMRLRMYRVFMDTVMLVREYELFSPLLAFSVVDNVVLLHQRQASVAVLLDLASESSEPVGSPLPLIEISHGEGEANTSQTAGIKKFSAKWQFFLPNIVVDEKGSIYRAQLDLPAIIASFTASIPLVGFLNRRWPSGNVLGDPRTLLLEVLRSILRRGESRLVLREVFDTLHKYGSEDVFPERVDKAVHSPLNLQSSLLEPRDVCKEVLGSVTDAREADAGYIENALVEYMESAVRRGIDIPVTAYLVMIDVLLRQGKLFQLQQLLAGSRDLQNLFVAEHLEAHADESGSEAVRKMSLNVYSRCGVRGSRLGKQAGCELYCKKLLKAGKVVNALRVAQHHQITSLAASTCLEAARKTGEPRIIQAAERFCAQPGKIERVETAKE